MTEQILSFIDFENTFTSIPLNILNIEPKENSDINELKNFNANI